MIKGQINLDTVEGKLIYDIIMNYDVKYIVEIGTWNGMGSTKCVIEAIKDKKQKINFQSVELYPEMFKQALENLSEDLKYVQLFNGKIIEYDDLFWFDHSTIDFNLDEHGRLYFKKDLEYIKSANNVLNSLFEKIDILILDGGEYSTYPEWQKLKNRTNIVILDDTRILKCSKIRKEIIESGEYITLYDDLNTRNGFSIFKRK